MRKNSFVEGTVVAYISILITKIIGAVYVIPFYEIIGTDGGVLYSYAYNVYNLFLKGVKENNINLKNPEVTLFMIIELVSSTCFNSILYKEPLPIEEYKPYLYDTIRSLIENRTIVGWHKFSNFLM